ncbi:DUF6456 domain-containing protein [Yoonia sp.]|uniref:DUF6456 domain-containing protein n=1 Tax=Yoonia sp. TaxID=2212373 RepID=UPI002FD8CFC0
MTILGNEINTGALPRWVPNAARNYLVHTEGGKSIRALARADDCHPSTVMRQVRRFEGRRDDPLVDGALEALSGQVSQPAGSGRRTEPAGLTQARIEKEAKRVLRRLAEQGAVLAAARDMETAVIVRRDPEGEQMRTAVVDREIAQAIALQEWIICTNPEGRIVRYVITNAGRAELRRLTARDENRAGGFVDTDVVGYGGWDSETLDGVARQPYRPVAQESPLLGLSRRRDRQGKPFLGRDLVAAGERLREDYELVEIGFEGFCQWQDVLDGMDSFPQSAISKGAEDALVRISAALADLGPGLADVALRCCCFLEGLEQTEKRMGWSARSGKIVLRIALERLKRHYAETQGRYGPLIG